jgi:DNA-binding transcriptional MerR regulator
MAMKVKEVADLVGTSVRTLHHYDEIGLLLPEETTESGYRLYSDDNLATLQQILFFRELGFPLKKIKEIVSDPSFDRIEALALHRKLLLEKRNRIDQMIGTIDKTIQHMKGEIEMTNQEKFEGFDFSYHPYEQEARERWGDEAVNNADNKLNSMSKDELKGTGERMNEIYRNLASLRHHLPESEAAQAGIAQWYAFLNSSTGHTYSLEVFKSLGQMYVEDERFSNNIDKFGEGLAVFMRDAMAVYTDRQQEG